MILDTLKKKLKYKKILIMAGGTGGHIFPAIAIAEELSSFGITVLWLGTKHGLELKIVQGRYNLFFLSIFGIRKKKLFKKILLPFYLILSIIQALHIILKNKVDCVISFGGYVSGPGGIAAKLTRTKLVIHEQNIKPGLTNLILSRFANEIFCAFPTDGFKKNKKVSVVGNPLKRGILNIKKNRSDFCKRHLNFLVTGGSQGAYVFNTVVPKLLSTLPKQATINILHQTGDKYFNQTNLLYKSSISNGAKIEVTPFIKNMDEAYQWADIVLCRAGALTVSEISAVGIPAIFVPYPYAVDNHQYYNAQFLVNANAAFCIRQSDFNVFKLSAFIRLLDLDRNKLLSMSKRSRGISKRNATTLMVSALK